MKITFAGALLALHLFVLSATCASGAATSGVPTGRLPRDVELIRTQLELQIDPAATSFKGIVRLSVDVKQSSRTLWLHGKDLNIARASIVPEGRAEIGLTGEQVDVSGVLRLTAASAIPTGKATVTIEYTAPYGGLMGVYKVRVGADDYVMTQMAPLGARSAFPGFDEPSFKAPWDITLIVPKAHVAVANTPLLREEPVTDDRKKMTFATTTNLPSYLVAFVVGPWDVVDWTPIPPSAVRREPIPLRGLAVKGQGQRLQYALRNTAQVMHALEGYFGSRYPYQKLDLVAMPDFSAGAMENAGLITYQEHLLFANEESPADAKQSYWIVHTHEVAHQWFGDLVTMPWWDDVWLNEAFATWMSHKIVAAMQPAFGADRVLMEDALRAMTADSFGASRSIRQPIKDFTDIAAAFDSITYSKGGAVLAMLERYVGEAAFRNGVRDYLRKHEHGNATSADLISAIGARSRDAAGVRAAFNSFLDQAGVPWVRTSLDCSVTDKPVLEVRQSRFLPLGAQASRDERWSLPLCVRYGDGDTAREQCTLIRDAQSRMPLESRSCPRWLMPNAQGAGYYRFALDDRDWSSLGANFKSLDPREQRAYADSLGAAFYAGTVRTEAYLSMLPQLASASARQTVTAPLSIIDWMLDATADEAKRARIRNAAARAYQPRLDQLGVEPQNAESDETRLLRAALVRFLAVTARVPELRATFAQKGRAALNGDAMSVDLRETALVLAAEEGNATTFEAMRKQFETSQDPILRGHLAAALGSFYDPALAERARALSLKPGTVRLREQFVFLRHQADVEPLRGAHRAWLEANFAAVSEKLSVAAPYAFAIYSVGLCGDAAAKELHQKFSDRATTMEGGPRMLAQQVEALRVCGAVRDAQL
jgi:cytosol alanyl aminopeptidase